jgi:hypothetical protein
MEEATNASDGMAALNLIETAADPAPAAQTAEQDSGVAPAPTA